MQQNANKWAKSIFQRVKFGYMKKKPYLCGEILKHNSMAEQIKFDKRNYRRHNDANKKIIRKSLEELGAGRSIVIDKEGEIIAGNGVYEQAEKLGLKTRVIETDGSELVVVKRTDLATADERRKKLALADNAASDMSDWDEELLREDWDAEVLADWGVAIGELPDESSIAELFEDAEGNGNNGEQHITILVPSDYDGEIESIKDAIRDAIVPFKGCKVK